MLVILNIFKKHYELSVWRKYVQCYIVNDSGTGILNYDQFDPSFAPDKQSKNNV